MDFSVFQIDRYPENTAITVSVNTDGDENGNIANNAIYLQLLVSSIKNQKGELTKASVVRISSSSKFRNVFMSRWTRSRGTFLSSQCGGFGLHRLDIILLRKIGPNQKTTYSPFMHIQFTSNLIVCELSFLSHFDYLFHCFR